MAFLSYDPSLNDYVWVESEQDVFFGEPTVKPPEVPVPKAGTTIGQIVRGTGTGGTTPIAGGGTQVGGSIYRAAAGFSAFGTVKDVLSAPSSLLEKAFTGFEGVKEYQTGVKRAEVFEAARKPTATVGELLAASQQDPSLLEHGKNLLMGGLSLFVGDIPGLIDVGIQAAADIKAEFESKDALEKAGQLEQEIISRGIPAPGTIGYVNTVNNFKTMQAANIAAAATEKTNLASLTPAQDIINQAVAQGVSTGSSGVSSERTLYERDASGDIIQRTEFSGGGSFSQNISENRRTAERRAEEGYTGSTSADRRGTTSTDGGTGGTGESFGGSREAGFGSSLGGGTGTVGGDDGWGR